MSSISDKIRNVIREFHRHHSFLSTVCLLLWRHQTVGSFQAENAWLAYEAQPKGLARGSARNRKELECFKIVKPLKCLAIKNAPIMKKKRLLQQWPYIQLLPLLPISSPSPLPPSGPASSFLRFRKRMGKCNQKERKLNRTFSIT